MTSLGNVHNFALAAAAAAMASAGSSSPPSTTPSAPASSTPSSSWANAAATLAATRSFLEKLNASHAWNPPPQVELRPSGFASDIMGAFAIQNIPAGTKYGPFLGKWAFEPINPNFAWQVTVASTGMKGFLDASEYGTWMKHIQCTNGSKRDERKPNIRYTLSNGQIFYETICEIKEGSELLLAPKEPIQLDRDQRDNNSAIIEDNEEVSSDKKPKNSSGPDEVMSSEEENDDEGVKCIKCEKLFQDIFSLDDHMIESHSHKPSQYQCEHCNKSFAWRPNLLRHKMVHGEFRRFPCENCDKVFTDPSNLQRHIRTNHVGARSHACPECGKTFATSSGLKQHTHIHSSVKPFRCEVCFKSYTQFSNLCRHKRMHANCRMQIKCHKCGQAFSTVTSLSKHRRFCDSTPSSFLAMQQQQQQQSQQPAQQQQQQQQQLHSSKLNTSNNSPIKMNSPNKLAGAEQLNGLHTDSVPVGASPYFPHHAAVAAAASSNNLFSPFAHLLGGGNFPPAAAAAAASAGPLGLLQNPHMLFPHFLRNLANQQLLANSQELHRQQQHHVSQRDKDLDSPDANKIKDSPKTFSPLTEKVNTIERPWLEKNVEKSSPKKEPKIEVKEETLDDKIDSESKEPVDFNRNISSSDDSKPVTNGNPPKKPENPLDLSVTKKEGEDDDDDENTEKDSEMSEPRDEIEVYDKKINNGSFKDEDDTESDKTKDDEMKEELDDESEPKGFKPVKEGKTFIPITDRVAKAQENESRNESSPLNGSLLSMNSPNSDVSSYPRTMNPYLLEAMYRMQQQQQQQQQRPSFFQHPTHQALSMSLAAANGANGSPGSPLGAAGARSPFFPPLLGSGSPQDPHSLLGRAASQYSAIPRSFHDMIPKNKDRYSCKFCGKNFPRSANLTRHLRTHTGEQPYKCKYCERSFSISSNLQRHVRNIHNKEKPFKCPLCDRSFGQQTNLDRHLKKHETCSDPSAIVDSPEGRSPEEEGYFDEIRLFMGKVTDTGNGHLPMDDSPPASDEQDIDVEEDDICIDRE